MSLNIKKSEIKNLIYPRSPNQSKYYNELRNLENQLLIGVGPAGCGKTYFSCQAAIHELQTKTIGKIVITRPLISVEREEIGFLPGKMNEKMDPWVRPIVDVLCEILSKETVENMILCNTIEISPLAYMRGRTFKDTFIIADEMQNSSPLQMRMLTTRIGHGSKMVINGDLEQSDYYKNEKNGLFDIINKIKEYHRDKGAVKESNDQSKIVICHMNNTDIYRSPIVSKILDIYNHVPFNHTLYSKNHYPSYRSIQKNPDDDINSFIDEMD
jgi:phosphate starvation-inducible PhoH-like protein